MFTTRGTRRRTTLAPLVPRAMSDRVGARAEAFAAALQPPRTTRPDRLMGALEASVELLTSASAAPLTVERVAELSHEQRHAVHGTMSYELDRAGTRYFILRRADRYQVEIPANDIEFELSLRSIYDYSRIIMNSERERELDALLHIKWQRLRAEIAVRERAP